MLRAIFSAFVILCATVGCCGPRHVDYFPYHDDGCPKPHVVLLPVVCSCQSQVPWNVCEALTQGVHYQLIDRGELYVLSPQEIGPAWEQSASVNFFDSDISFAKEFCDADFVVAIELIEEGSTPVQVCTGDCHAYQQMVTMKARLRVIDVRRSTPRNVVFEVIKSDYLLVPSDCSDYSRCRSYAKTPCGIVQQRMITTLSQRMEEVIRCSR